MTDVESDRPSTAVEVAHVDAQVKERAGQSNAPEGSARSHTLIVFANDKPGALDRIVGVLRRRRAATQTFTLGRSELPGVLRITVVIDDSEVEVDHLIEQLRKLVDVQHIINLASDHALARELALIKVNTDASHYGEIIELGHLYGAHVVDVTNDTVTLEVTGSEEKVESLVNDLQKFGIREIARTGRVAMTRGTQGM
jgi:acetolactate synthase I/III small subunit